METVTCLLGDYEVNPNENTAVTLGWQFALSTDAEGVLLEAALRRSMKNVVEKWRLLAGRVKWCPEVGERGRWAILVPTGELPETYSTHSFRVETVGTPIPLTSSLDALDPADATLLHRPPPSYFRNFKVAASTKSCLNEDAPILSMKVTVFSDCLCVGLSLPHGVCDGEGMGQIVAALNAEMNGLDWSPPPLVTTSNLLSDAIAILPASTEAERRRTPQVFRDYRPFSLRAVAAFLARYLVEKLWFRVKMRGVFLGNDLVQRLKRDVEKEVKLETEGHEWVSGGDILVAWLLKAAYASQPNRRQKLHVTPVYSLRSILSAFAICKDLLNYIHNAAASFSLPILRVSDLPKTSLATLALMHRRALNSARTIPYIKANMEYFKRNPANIPVRKWDRDSWMVTNQCSANLTKLSRGDLKISRFWIWFFPISPSHGLSINKLENGYVLTSKLRPEQWRSIERELERLRNGHAKT